MAEPSDPKLYPTITRTEFNYIGKPGTRRKEGLAKVSGRAKYTRDIVLPGMLYAKPLLSPYRHAKIKSVDKSKAEALPGVKLVVTPFDPDVKNLTFVEQLPTGTTIKRPLFRDEVHWYGNRSGVVVVADSELICDEALRLIEVEWEELPWEIDWNKALEPGAPLLYPDVNPKNNILLEREEEYGDVEKGFTEADKIVEWNLNVGENTCPVEPFSDIAMWSGDQLELWVKCQMGPGLRPAKIYATQFAPLNKITATAPYQGATFGGSSTTGATLPSFAIFLAKKTGRPVKFVHSAGSFEPVEEMMGTYKYKAGCKNDGTITAFSLESVYAFRGSAALWTWKDTAIPNQYHHQVNPMVNRPPLRCLKHGAPYCSVKMMVDNHVAEALGMDPTTVALKNDGCKGHTMEWVTENVKKAQGFPLVDSLKACIDAGKKAIGWDEKWHAPGTKILPNGNYHGLAFTSMHEWTYDLGGKGGSFGGIYAQEDGSVSLYMQLAEFGVDHRSPCCRVVADELGVKYEDVEWNCELDYGFYGHDDGCGGACISNCMTFAKAARMLKRQILEAAVTPPENAPKATVSFPGLKPEDLDIKESMVFEKAKPDNKQTFKDVVFRAYGTRTKFQRLPGFAWAWTKNPDTRGNEKEGLIHFTEMAIADMWSFPRQAAFVEVEVNPETGQTSIIKYVAVQDVGKVISPEGVELQQMAGGWGGLGRSLTLDIYNDPQTGVRLSNDHIQYPILLMNDCKAFEGIALENGQGYGPYGADGIGECGIALPSFLIEPAVHNAIGKWLDIPCTPDKVLKALGKG